MAAAIELDGGEEPRIYPYERRLPEEDAAIAPDSAEAVELSDAAQRSGEGRSAVGVGKVGESRLVEAEVAAAG